MGVDMLGARTAQAAGTQALLGRSTEIAALRRLITQACAGTSGVLVLHGEAGIGKTTLLDNAQSEFAELRVLRVENPEAEAALSFAGLQHLTSALTSHVGSLPQPQREALGVALGRRQGPVPDHLHLGLAVLNLLSAAAETRPVVCLVDDVQWMDRSSLAVLAFVARRVSALRIAIVIAAEDVHDIAELTGLPTHAVRPLGDREARELLDSTVRAPLDQRVRERVLTEARGNPLALLHLPCWIGPTEMTARLTRGDVRAPKRLEESFKARLSRLPAEVRFFLLLAAAEPDGDPLVVRPAAALADISPDAAAVAEAAGILDTNGTRMSFRHPLLRSMVYAAASAVERRGAHAALAECCDPVQDPDRYAWHLGQAAAGFDEDVAGRLETAARGAVRRSGAAVAGGFWELAAALTADRAVRASRLLSAAWAKQGTGAFAEALAILSALKHEPMPDPERGQVALLHARNAYAIHRDEDAAMLLVDAACLVAGQDPRTGRYSLLDAFHAIAFSGHYLTRERVRKIVARTAALDLAAEADDSTGHLLTALITSLADGRAAAAPLLARAVQRCLADAGTAAADVPFTAGTAGLAALQLWDAHAWRHLVERQMHAARAERNLAALPLALNQLALAHVYAGDLTTAGECAAEAHSVTEATGTAPLRYADLALAAWQGDEPRTLSLVDLAVREAVDRREGRLHTAAEHAQAVLYNGAGRPEAVLAATGRLQDGIEAVYSGLLAAERVEAAVACGQRAWARSACGMLKDNAERHGTPWAEATYLRAQALLERGPAAELLFQRSIEQFTAAGAVLQTARTRLLWGEWLLTSGRRAHARDPLRAARAAFSAAGAHAFAARAGIKLSAAGERAVRPSTGVHTLTAQELRVARMVARGETSREIGAALFVSPRTVDAHVRSILRKLDVASRRQLRHIDGLRTTGDVGREFLAAGTD
ncbi:LuxR family transcriptional regulator [Streptomyces sp. MA15]|uniref:helix-turn-helix transcriptional regulator n=1 Tax=Streptomyces sp. MA15 TaxID=3055061 RepID=UPI0025B15D31|nr:LuxR family transcriptional regulator [Streptomyces sp. MA15]MDN3270345.1 AAA family ATPase [Streptomyces sp. MA15]